MKTLRFSLHILFVALVVLAFSSLASAQATRTWVSGVGDDANPCSRTAPCKTFAGAISKTAAGGIIDCLDPGGFGAVTITKSIQIDCDAGPGGVLVAGTNGIIISGVGINVELRSLNIDGLGQPGSNSTAGINGVQILQANAVHLVDMNIEGFSASCVNVNVTATVNLSMQNVNMHECGAAGVQTNAAAGGPAVGADLDRVSVWGSTNGVNAQNGTRMQIHNSTFFNNTVGINQSGLNGTGSVVTVFQSSFTDGTALQSITNASIGAASCLFSNNGTVFFQNGGLITSTGDNVLNGNGATGNLGVNGIIKM